MARQPPRLPVRIGARGSKLSLVQAGTVRQAIAAYLGDDEAAVVLPFTTSGDRLGDARLADIGGKGLFTAEIEQALAEGAIDCAVHSMKDMPALGPAGLVVAATPARADPRDALVGPWPNLEALPRGARLGTSSLRRAAQALGARPDLAIVPLRGNVDTRLAKLARGEADAILLAAAGLQRLGLEARIAGFLDPIDHPPAPGQGALAVQARAADAEAPWLAALDDPGTALCVSAERGALAALEGSCRTAIGAYARLTGGEFALLVEALTPDGSRRFRRAAALAAAASPAEAADLGARLGRDIAAEAGSLLLA